MTVFRSLLIVSALLGVVSCVRPPDDGDTGLTLAATLGGADTAGYARATEVRTFVFPGDHGPHRMVVRDGPSGVRGR